LVALLWWLCFGGFALVALLRVALLCWLCWLTMPIVTCIPLKSGIFNLCKYSSYTRYSGFRPPLRDHGMTAQDIFSNSNKHLLLLGRATFDVNSQTDSDMAKHISAATLHVMPAQVSVPVYQREQLSAAILHIGVGNFHRAHQAVYLDELFNTGDGHDWAIIGAGVRETDEVMREKLLAQDLYTTVVEQEATHSTARITGAMIDYIKPGDTQTLIARLADPAIRIVSLTITEGGYYIDSATGKFDENHPEIRHDAANPDAPKSVFGLLLAGLARRRIAGVAPFTVMSCDNIPHNGVVTRNSLMGLAVLAGDGLDAWVGDHVAFPNGMVDRITPATTNRERALLRDEFGIEDKSPVFCEGFKQWVLEDNFPSGRPSLEKVGVQFVKDVSPFELMKIRILNGGHAVIAYPAALMDIHFVHDAMQDELIKGFLDKIENDEIIPSVPPVPDTDTKDYYRLIVRRFSNPKIGDTIARLCLDGSNRQPKFIIPTIAVRLKDGKAVTGLGLVSALWCRYCYGETDSGKHIAPNDPPQWDRLQAVAKAAKKDPAVWLAMHDIYGDTAHNPALQIAFANALNALWKNGTRETLARYIAGTSAPSSHKG
jgi:mannitol 2-dehydrogenase